MKKIVIGTAGHIDHGKTTLIKALTGIDCDRLKEEKERGITTELGFAHYRFGDDLLVGVVDVPGHERFVRHMVAGAWGIDMVLLVVAADEGVMPQTREHLDICAMLGLKRAIVAVTKKDIVDEEMLELVKEDISDFLRGTPFEDAPVIPVSSSNGENIEFLKDAIKKMAEASEERSKQGIFRLPVDRVFTLKGLGTIVTGTCISGSIRTGEEIEIFPSNRRAKIRNIQTYHEDTDEASAGERVALNLQGIDRNDIERGAIIGRHDTLITTNRIDASFKYLKLPFKGIKNDAILRFHVATTLEEARLILLDRDIIEPGEEAYIQFVFYKPIVALPGDRFILRGSYLIQTLGGGEILDIAPQRHKRKSPGLPAIYKILRDDSPYDKAGYHIKKGGYAGMERTILSALLGKEPASAEKILEEMKNELRIKQIGKLLIDMEKFREFKNLLKACVSEYHEKNPLKIGIPKEELRTKLPRVETVIFQTALDEFLDDGSIEVEKDKVIAKSVRKKDRDIDALEENILTMLSRYGLTPPYFKELASELKKTEEQTRDLLEGLVHKNRVVKVNADLYFHRDVIETLKDTITDYIKKKGELTPSDFKSLFDISRKYMIPILEHLDDIKLTIRVGDKRVLRSRNN